jgi:hypothetical protein
MTKTRMTRRQRAQYREMQNQNDAAVFAEMKEKAKTVETTFEVFKAYHHILSPTAYSTVLAIVWQLCGHTQTEEFWMAYFSDKRFLPKKSMIHAERVYFEKLFKWVTIFQPKSERHIWNPVFYPSLETASEVAKRNGIILIHEHRILKVDLTAYFNRVRGEEFLVLNFDRIKNQPINFHVIKKALPEIN